MGYKNASCVLPDNLIAAIQQHIDGEYLYIPRKIENKKAWGELKNSRQLYAERNAAITTVANYTGYQYTKASMIILTTHGRRPQPPMKI